VLDSYPVLKEYRNAIANLPEIAAFYRSAGFCRQPWKALGPFQVLAGLSLSLMPGQQ